MTDATLSPETLKAITQKARKHQRDLARAEASKLELHGAIAIARADGHSLQSIGDRLGVSAQRVDQILRAQNNH